ncbi:MAG: crossover junction endodeoxyribonuclease RuvC [Firmicutes bacterium]|nr:crossover junction endodeoxyribonuclease RuvC [Bacillota bacterium]
MRIMGIDPGVAVTGYGVVEEQGDRWRRVVSGCIRTGSRERSPERLAQIYRHLEDLINSYRPQAFSVERLFFCKNTRSALQVGEARGVVILVAALNKLELFEYTPLQIKKAVSSFGRAGKGQVQNMVRLLLQLKNVTLVDDEADALAAALCHLQHRKWQLATGSRV